MKTAKLCISRLLTHVADICRPTSPSSRTCQWRNSFIFIASLFHIFVSTEKWTEQGGLARFFVRLAIGIELRGCSHQLQENVEDCKFHLRTTIGKRNGKRHQNFVQNYLYEYAPKDTCCSAGWRARDHDSGRRNLNGRIGERDTKSVPSIH